MNPLKKQFHFLAFLLIIVSMPLLASDNLNPAQLVIKGSSDQVHSILLTEREALANDRQHLLNVVSEIIEPLVDLNKVSRLVLGKYWRKATEEQRLAFQKEFRMLLFNTYAASFADLGEWELKFIPVKAKADAKRMMIKTEIIQSSRPPIAVNYRMIINKQEQWKVYDIIIEGISMVTNYRSGFASRIKKSGGLDKVIQDLAAKNNSSHSVLETKTVALETNKS